MSPRHGPGSVNLREVGRFVVSGALAGLCSWATCAGLVQLGWGVDLAGMVGYGVSIPISFLAHRWFSFRSPSPWASQGLRFVWVALAMAWVAGQVMAAAQRLWPGLSLELAMLLSVAVVTPLNYGVLKLLVFWSGSAAPPQ